MAEKRPMERMACDFEVKAKDENERTFEGALSTSHLDLGNRMYRDIVHPGAFKRTLDHFRNSKKGYVPLLDSHKTESLFNILGHLVDAEETLTGKALKYETAEGKTLEVPEMLLNTKWRVIDGVDGERVMDRLRPGSLRKMSMGYAPYQYDFVNLKEYGKTRNLREVGLGEGSLLAFPMNPEAEVNTASVKTLAQWQDMDEDERKAYVATLPEQDKAALRALLAPQGPVLAHEDTRQELRKSLLRLNLHQLATRTRGPAPVGQTIATMSDRINGEHQSDQGVAA
jgi:HK97 family phage prohead protease